MLAVLALEGVSKRYIPNETWALEGITLEVFPGSVVVLLGPNGAGKTTLLKLALGILRPTEGRISAWGGEVENARQRIGYLPQGGDYHTNFTAHEYLRWLGLMGGNSGRALEKRIAYLLDRLALTEYADKRLATYSRDLLQRVGIAQALLPDPDLLLLDEPHNHLESEGQAELESLIHEWSTPGKTCVIALHSLTGAVRWATHLGLLKKGRLVDFRAWSGDALAYLFSLSVPPLSPEVLQALEPWKASYHPEKQEILVASSSDSVPPDLLRTLLDHDVPLRIMTPRGLSLPDIYASDLEEEGENGEEREKLDSEGERGF